MIADGWLGRIQRRRPLRAPARAVRSRAAVSAPGRPRSRPHPPPRLVLVLAVAAMLALGAWLWVRDSSLVSVDRVSVTGQTGPDSTQIRSALVASARTMTTLDVRMDQLRMAVAPYPVVKDLQISTQFPHGMRILVIEQIPVGAVVVGGRTIAVAGDGTLLHDVVASPALPAIPLRVPPGGTRVSEPDARGAVALLAAAPYQLIARISQVTTVSGHGLVAQIRSGPSIYFGDASRLAAKWIAATAVLADSGSAGALYVDVTDPARPVAGAPPPGAPASTATTPSPAGSAPNATTPSSASATTPSSATATTPSSATATTPTTASSGG